MEQADEAYTGVFRHTLTQLYIDDFLRTPYGKVARPLLLVLGKAHIPLFRSEQEAREKAELMLSCVANVIENRQGKVRVSWMRRVLSRIKEQDRFMSPPQQFGTDFVRIAKEAERTISYVVRALDNSGPDRVIVEQGTCLISLEGILRQVNELCSRSYIPLLTIRFGQSLSTPIVLANISRTVGFMLHFSGNAETLTLAAHPCPRPVNAGSFYTGTNTWRESTGC